MKNLTVNDVPTVDAWGILKLPSNPIAWRARQFFIDPRSGDRRYGWKAVCLGGANFGPDWAA